MRKRRLTGEELELWSKVAEHTERLPSHVVKKQRSKLETLDEPKRLEAEHRSFRMQSFELGSKAAGTQAAHSLKQSVASELSARPVQMDDKVYRRMKRGKLKPEGKLDLHGMTLDTAHGALTRFVLSAHSSGKRLVLVITGKGKLRDEQGPMPAVRGVLRHQVPQWLSLPPVSNVVMQVVPAHLSHGGDGAYYVYLRRPR